MTAAAGQHRLAVGNLAAEHIAGAAFSLRHGELVAAEQRRAQQARIEDARAAGRTWVTLQERGSLEAGLLDPFQSVEMHLGSGLAIVTTVEVDLASGGPNYVLATARFDPGTGVLLDADPGAAGWTEHDDVAGLVAARQALAARIEEQA